MNNFTLVDEFMICDVHMDAHEFRTLCLLSAQVWDEAENSQTSCSVSVHNGFPGIKLETVAGVNNTTRRPIIWQHKTAIANKLFLCVCLCGCGFSLFVLFSFRLKIFFFFFFLGGIFAQGRKHLQLSGDLKYFYRMGKAANKCIVEKLLPMCFIMFGPKMSIFLFLWPLTANFSAIFISWIQQNVKRSIKKEIVVHLN